MRSTEDAPLDCIGLDQVALGAARLSGDLATNPVVVVDLDGTDWSDSQLVDAAAVALRQPSVVSIGLSRDPLPEVSRPVLEELSCTLAPGGPGRTWIDERCVDELVARVHATPLAAQSLTGLLKATSRINVFDALHMESLTYSMLLGGPEFTAWLTTHQRRPVHQREDSVLVSRTGDRLEVTLNQPERHNAFGAAMRDGVVDALELALLDPTIGEVLLTGAGRSFSSGGDLDEFGTANDPVSAHLTRSTRSAAWALYQVCDRVRVVLHGACVGAGVEVPSFAGRVEARPGTWFLLPELGMGLIPGAGGTVGITRRIGRWRTAYLALAGTRLDLDTALEWVLVDGVA
jgi:hypothetical protein